MTHEELLAGYLENSLSAQQLLELQAVLAADPVLAAEIARLQKLESILAEAQVCPPAPAEVIAEAETSVINKMNFAPGSRPFVQRGLGSWILWGAAVIVLVLLGVGLALVTGNDNVQPVGTDDVLPRQDHAETKVLPDNAEAPLPANQIHTQKEQRPDQVKIREHVNAVRPDNDQVQSQVTNHNNDTERSLGLDANQPTSALSQLISEYQRCLQQGQEIRCAQLALAIGRQYRKNGDVANALHYLETALSQAESAKTVQQQIQILTELALTNIGAGNTKSAQTFLSKAISLAESKGLPATQQKELLKSLE